MTPFVRGDGATAPDPVGPAMVDEARHHTAAAVEEVVRTSYGRLVAYLASTTGDIAGAEDALSDAFVAALRTWPINGVPARPVSWMLTAARRSLIGRHRRAAVADRAAPTLALLREEQLSEEQEVADLPGAIPDRRLELLYACAHPAIDPSLHPPLMLQTVFGLDAVRMGEVFLVPGPTLGQRLVRAKRKIRDAGVPFRVPGSDELAARTGAVLDAVYAAYGSGWDDPTGLDPTRSGLTAEALRLVELLVELQPDDAEVRGLAALLWHTEARREARRGDDGEFVALGQQPVERWSRSAIESGEHHLSIALSRRSIGPYQLMAAVQSVHNRRAATGTTDWAAIARLYDGLAALTPTVGVLVARAAARLEAIGPEVAAADLAVLPADRVDGYQPYWVLRGEAARRRGDPALAAASLERALALTADPAVRAHLEARFADCGPARPSSDPSGDPSGDPAPK